MTLFLSLSNLCSILIYSISLGFCWLLFGKSGSKILKFAGLLMFTYLLYAVYRETLSLLSLTESTHTLRQSIELAFTIAEIYLLGRIIYLLFQKSVPSAFYIWLCIIIIITGLISPLSIDLTLWDFIAYNISVVVIGTIYWDAYARESDTAQHKEAYQYRHLMLAAVILGIVVLAYCVTNLSLFQKFPSRSFMELYRVLLSLIISVWFLHFCSQALFTPSSVDTSPLPSAQTSEAPRTLSQIDSFRTQYELTEREAEILQLILIGKSNQEISEALFITVGTVKAHVHSIFSKLDISRRSQLMSFFLEHEPNP